MVGIVHGVDHHLAGTGCIGGQRVGTAIGHSHAAAFSHGGYLFVVGRHDDIAFRESEAVAYGFRHVDAVGYQRATRKFLYVFAGNPFAASTGRYDYKRTHHCCSVVNGLWSMNRLVERVVRVVVAIASTIIARVSGRQ